MPRTIVAIKPGSSRPGASGVTRYISESKRDPKKEDLREKEARPLFSSSSDNLNYHQADLILGEAFGGKAQRDEVIHLVISLEPEQFEALGDTVSDQKEALREVIRETAKEINATLKLEALNWIAGIHLNTDNPHVHIAISREGLDADTREFKRIEHLPRVLLPHHETEAGEKVFKSGLIADAVARNLDLAQEHVRAQRELATTQERPGEPARQTQEPRTAAQEPKPQERPDRDTRTAEWSEQTGSSQAQHESRFRTDPLEQNRLTLGRAMVVAAEVERLDRELTALTEHGDKRRFRVFDASHGRTRQISQFDVHRRADTRAAAVVRQQEIVDPDKRNEVRQSHYKTEVDQHDKAIRDHNIILQKSIKKTSQQLADKTTEHSTLQAEVRDIVSLFQQRKEQLPTPLLTRPELSKLQDQSVSNGNPVRFATLERIRQSLAVEHKAPTRTDTEIARLEGQLLLARAEQAARLARLQQFNHNRHQTRWDIGKEKHSLVSVERLIEEKENRSKIFGAPFNLGSINILPSRRRAAAAACTELKGVRDVVLQKIEERQQSLEASVKEALKMTEALSTVFVGEQEKQLSRGGERLEKDLRRHEISRLVEHSLNLADPAMLRQSLILESQHNDRQQDRYSIDEQSSKATGREIIVDVALKGARERLDAFLERKDFVPVIVKDIEGKETTSRIFDFHEPSHPMKLLAARLFESKEERHLRQETHKAIDFHGEQLSQDVKNLEQCREIVGEHAAQLRDQVRGEGREPPDAAFTTKQIMQLEIYAHRQPDPNERDRIMTLIESAELTHHVFTPLAYDNSQAVTSAVRESPLDRDSLSTQLPDHATDFHQQPHMEIGRMDDQSPTINESIDIDLTH